MAGEGDLIKTPREPWNQDMERAEKVNFLIGDNESLDIKELEEEEEEMSEEGSPGGVRMKDDLVAKAVKSVMVEEVKEKEGGVMVTELPILLPEVLSSQPAPLPSLMCCTPEYTPGTVLQVSLRRRGCVRHCLLQGCYQAAEKCEAWRAPLQVLVNFETSKGSSSPILS